MVGLIKKRVTRMPITKPRTKRARLAPNPIRMDPTRTATLRRMFMGAFRKRLNRLKREIVALVVDEDAFGLGKRTPYVPFVGNQTSFSSVQCNVSKKTILNGVRIRQSFLLPEDIQELETQPHITVRFGLHTKDPTEVEKITKGFGLIKVNYDELHVFRNDDSDILVALVDSPHLHDLNSRLSALPNTVTHPVYTPHMTLAYLKPGTGDKYLKELKGFNKAEEWFHSTTFSPPDKVQSQLVTQQRFRFQTQSQQVKSFQQWLMLQTNLDVMTVTQDQAEDAYWKAYVQEGYRKGAGRAFDDVNKAKRAGVWTEKDQAFYAGNKQQFLQSAFGRPVAIEKVKLLAGRVFTELKGVVEAMGQGITRELIEGISQGKSPREVGREMAKKVDTIGRKRADMIARTETIRAHAEGQLDAMEQLGVTELGVMVEWAATGDRRTCELCSSLEGIVVKLKEARGMIPRHPNCRCAFTPANLGEDETKQKRGPEVREAIDESIGKERSKRAIKDGVSVGEQKKRSSWEGADKGISKVRPRSILEDRETKKRVIEKRARKRAEVQVTKIPKVSAPSLPIPKSNTVVEARKWAEDNGGMVVQMEADEAAEALATWVNDKNLVSSTVLEYRKEQKHIPTKSEIKSNWLKTFRSRKDNKKNKAAFSGLNEDLQKRVQEAANQNRINREFQKYVDREGTPPLMVLQQETGQNAAARWRGGIHIYDHPFANDKISSVVGGVIPGQTTAGSTGGLAAEIRHEYGHGLFDKFVTFDNVKRSKWQSMYSEMRKSKVIQTDVTYYASTNGAELFCEAFAIMTDPNFNRALFSPTANRIFTLVKEMID